MAHQNQIDFCESIKTRFPEFFSDVLALDIGSLDLNGNNQYLFENSRYLGLDLMPGKNVDIVGKGHELALPDHTFDTVISTECFEHDRFYEKTLVNAVRMLKPGGMFIFTCATTGRPEHGTSRTTPHDAPFIQSMGEWADYYKNLTEDDVRAVFDLDSIFSFYEFSVDDRTHDLYFAGIKAKESSVTSKSGEAETAHPHKEPSALYDGGRKRSNSNQMTTSKNSNIDRSSEGAKAEWSTESEAGIFISCPNQDGGLFLLQGGRITTLDRHPSAGISSSGDIFYRGKQPFSLVVYGDDVFDRTDESLDDIHDVLYFRDHVYVVGTLGNQIIKFDLAANELKRWTYSGQPDSRHINCVGVWNGRIVFSAFGDFAETHGYKGNTPGSGYVEDLESGERLITGLNQPHSLVQFGDNLLVANSGEKEIREYTPSGRLLRKKRFAAYARGIAAIGEHIFVGLSRSREADDNDIKSAALVTLRADTWEEIAVASLPSREVYALHSVEQPSLVTGLSTRITHDSITRYDDELKNTRQWLTERDNHVASLVRALRELDDQLCQKYFDAEWYSAQYPALAATGLTPEAHYFSGGGAEEGRLPASDPYAFASRVLSEYRQLAAESLTRVHSEAADRERALNTREFGLASKLNDALQENATLMKQLSDERVAAEKELTARVDTLREEIETKSRASSARELVFVDTLQQLHAKHERQTREQQTLHTEREEHILDQLSQSQDQCRQLLVALYDREKELGEQLLAQEKAYEQSKALLVSDFEQRESELQQDWAQRESELQQDWIQREADLREELDTAAAEAKKAALQLAETQQALTSTVARLERERDDRENTFIAKIEAIESASEQQLTTQTAELLAYESRLNEQNLAYEQLVGTIRAAEDTRVNVARQLREVARKINRPGYWRTRSSLWPVTAGLEEATSLLDTAFFDASRHSANTATTLHANSVTQAMVNASAAIVPPRAAVSISELLSHADEAFIFCAYTTLLRREPDAAGREYYLRRLRSGVDKGEIVAQLSLSKEGKARGVDLPGLAAVLRVHWWRSLPLVGKLLRRTATEHDQALRQISAHLHMLDARMNMQFENINSTIRSLGATPHDPVSEQAPTPTLELVAPSAPPMFNMRPASGAPIVILTVKHCLYIAHAMQASLAKADIHAKIIFERPEQGYDDVPHIVICPQIFAELPGFYVAFQMEQSVSSRWFTPEYFRTLENSFAVFDYSIDNVAYLQEHGLSRRQIYHLPIGYIPNYRPDLDDVESDCDVLFYGDINNERRRRFITEIEKHYRVKVINDTFGPELQRAIAGAKLVINVHYYAGALLETTRIYECLSLNTLVVSESSSDMMRHSDLAGLVDFVEIDDVSAMVSRIDHWLKNDDLRLQKIAANRATLESQSNRFDYFLYRFLLASDNITFDQFWSLIGHTITLPSDRLCLTLPEDVRRGTDFMADNHYGFSMFPGLRHAQGWIGCAMSYKFMIMLARQQNFSSITICEDDVEFPSDFAAQWHVIESHLDNAMTNWNIFSGLLANLSEEVTVLDAQSSRGQQYVTVDKLISTVFNRYNCNIFDLIANWDPENRDVQTNTIDRYLESRKALKVVTTEPFLVGHKEDHVSTIWGFKNTQYVDLISASKALLSQKLAEYRTKNRRLKVKAAVSGLLKRA